ncbi:MAG: hypothetical protein FWB91_13055 [Defluviitaleaceae bacterium]|nr:hypothetical protein [Defluviitaleaceae bacterium]
MTIQFRRGTQAGYSSLTQPRNADTLFFTSDTNALYKGDELISDGVRIVTARPSNPAHGILYFNINTKIGEAFDGTDWHTIIGDDGRRTNRFVSTEEITAGIGTLLPDLDLTVLTPLLNGAELAEGDIVIFPGGIRGEATAIDTTAETYSVVIIFIDMTGVRNTSELPIYDETRESVEESATSQAEINEQNAAHIIEAEKQIGQLIEDANGTVTKPTSMDMFAAMDSNRMVVVPISTIGGFDPPFVPKVAKTRIGDPYGTEGIYLSTIYDETDPQNPVAVSINVQVKTWAGRMEWGTF